MYDYTSNYQEDTVRRYQALYEKFKGIYHALLLAQDEGVFEITVRSQTGVVQVPVSFGDGTEIAAMMVENFSKRVDRMQDLLNDQLTDAAAEIEHDKKRVQQKQEAIEAEAAQVRANIANHQTQAGQLAIARELLAKHNASLGQQAAATAATPQKGPGRPRKAQPVVAQELAVAASAVPMNGTSQLPGGGVANQPQG